MKRYTLKKLMEAVCLIAVCAILTAAAAFAATPSTTDMGKTQVKALTATVAMDTGQFARADITGMATTDAMTLTAATTPPPGTVAISGYTIAAMFDLTPDAATTPPIPALGTIAEATSITPAATPPTLTGTFVGMGATYTISDAAELASPAISFGGSTSLADTLPGQVQVPLKISLETGLAMK